VVAVPERHGRRCIAVVVARDEEPRLGRVLESVPDKACGMPVDVVVVDDGSRDRTAELARAAGAAVISHAASRGLGAALRTGLAYAREHDYHAAVYLDGDGEYDAAELPTVLEPIARARADYVLGSRFLAERDGMSWHRTLANRITTALMGTLMGTVMSDGQTGYRAFSRRALAAAEIRHDYNYAQVLTLSLWGAGIDPVEVGISYRRRDGGRSFVRYPEYLVRVAPAGWRQWRDSKRARRRTAHPRTAASTYGPGLSPKYGNAPVRGPNGASGRGVTSPPEPSRTST
jgi:glycosyltransferase involved in cell wall biosynthesis